MDRNEIKEMLREVLGPNVELIDHPDWVGMHCPMAKFTHEKGVDSTPSAGVSIKENGDPSVYNCFVCGKGTVPWFLRQMEKYTGESYTQIIRNIETGEFLGGSLPEWGAKKVAKKVEKFLDKDTYLDLYDSAEGHPYFPARAAKEKEVCITDETVRLLQLMVDPGDSAGEERILFPVFSKDGDLYGFTGRATDDRAELRVRDYHGLPKARVLLGLHLVRPEDTFVVVVEGLFDYAVGAQFDYPTVAALHAGLTPEQIRLLIDLGKPVVLMFDDDQAGRDATEKAIKALKKHLPLSTVTYPKPPLNPRGRKIKWLKDPAGCSKEQMDQMIAKAKIV